MTNAGRLKALESKLVKPVDDYVPVDLTPFLSEVSIAGVAHHNGKRRKNESVLSAYARGLGVSVAALWKCAYSKPAKLKERHLAVDPHCRHLDGVVTAVVLTFMVEEFVWQMLESIDLAGGIPLGERVVPVTGPVVGLCRVRPLRPVT